MWIHCPSPLVETPVVQTGSLSASGCFILKGWTTSWQPHQVQDCIPRCLGDEVPLPLAEGEIAQRVRELTRPICERLERHILPGGWFWGGGI